MSVRTFLRLYILSAILGSSGLWWVALQGLAVASDLDRGNGVQSGLDGGGSSLPSLSGGQEPPSLPGNPVRHNGRNDSAKESTPGSVRSSSSSIHFGRDWGAGMANAQSVGTQSMKVGLLHVRTRVRFPTPPEEEMARWFQLLSRMMTVARVRKCWFR